MWALRMLIAITECGCRNLSFQTRIYEGNLLLEYNLLDLNEHRFTPYASGGFALYHFNPFASDSLGINSTCVS